MQVVVVVFDSGGQFRRHEPQPVHRVGVLSTDCKGFVVGVAVGIRIFLGAVIAGAADALSRSENLPAVFVVRREGIEAQAAAVDLVVELLGDVGFVGRTVEQVAAAAELVDMVVFGTEARSVAGPVITPESEGLGVNFRNVRKSVPVTVVPVAVFQHAEEVDACFTIIRNERGVERCVDVGFSAGQHTGRVGQRGEVAQRFFRNDVHYAADGARSVQGRSPAADHLDPLDHADGHLFEPVHSGQGTENGTAVDQDLGVLAFQSVNTQLGRAAVPAIVFDAQARLEIHSFGQCGR